MNGKETKGELQNVHYIPDVHIRLISIGMLSSQGWEPRLSRNSFALYDGTGSLILQVQMKNNVHSVTLRTIYPNFGFCTCIRNEVSDEMVHERLEPRRKSPLAAFAAGGELKPVSLFD